MQHDVTEIKKTEALLRQASIIAENASKAKSEFLANMSHEIRTPMNAIMGMVNLCMQTDTTPKQYDYLEKINNASHSLLRILNDILDFSKIEAGRLEMESTPFQLEDVFNNLVSLISQKAHEKELEILFKFDRTIPSALVGDPLRLEQILVNFASNAIKFTETGEIVISSELMFQDTQNVKIRFSVRDTGIGLTQEQISRLFQSFSQADTSTTRKFGGTGLGLAISKHLVELMNGEISVDSEPAKGSTFTFTAQFQKGILPLQAKLTFDIELKHMRVLVIDDNASARDIIKEMLSSFSLETELANSGKAGLQALQVAEKQGKPFQLIVMDLKMPGLDGFETARHVKFEIALAEQPKIILLTAFDDIKVRQHAEEFKLDGFLTKPVSHSILFDAIMIAFGKQDAKRRQSTGHLNPNRKKAIANALQGCEILLVEDNKINQQVAVELLELSGLSVTVAQNGQEAVKILENKVFDVVLMDLQMPVMDGYTATSQIRKIPHLHNMPIIAMTANAMKGEKDKCLALGMNDFVAKPIAINDLFSALMRWVQPQSNIPVNNDSMPIPSNMENAIVQPNLEHLSFDVVGALTKLGGNKKLYYKIISSFLSENQATAATLTSTLDTNDQETAARIVHTTKGLAGNMGAGTLQQASATLEVAIKQQNNESIVAALAQFNTALEHVLNEISVVVEHFCQQSPKRTSLSETPAQNSSLKSENTQQLLAILKQLELPLQRRKPKLCEPLLDELQTLDLTGEMLENITQLLNEIKKYRFKDAQALCATLTHTIQSKGQNNGG